MHTYAHIIIKIQRNKWSPLAKYWEKLYIQQLVWQTPDAADQYDPALARLPIDTVHTKQQKVSFILTRSISRQLNRPPVAEILLSRRQDC